MNELLPYVPWLLLIVMWAVFLFGGKRWMRETGDRTLRKVDPPSLGSSKGYTNAIVVPSGASVVLLAGQTARGADQRIVGGGMARQWDQALANVVTVAEAAGARPTDIARMTVYVTDLDAYRSSQREIGKVWRERIGAHYPAMTLVAISGLVDEGAMVEIEATAVIA